MLIIAWLPEIAQPIRREPFGCQIVTRAGKPCEASLSGFCDGAKTSPVAIRVTAKPAGRGSGNERLTASTDACKEDWDANVRREVLDEQIAASRAQRLGDCLDPRICCGSQVNNPPFILGNQITR